MSHPAIHCSGNLSVYMVVLRCVLLQTGGQVCHFGDVITGVGHRPLIGTHLVDQGLALHCKQASFGEVQLAHEHQVTKLVLGQC